MTVPRRTAGRRRADPEVPSDGRKSGFWPALLGAASALTLPGGLATPGLPLAAMSLLRPGAARALRDVRFPLVLIALGCVSYTISSLINGTEVVGRGLITFILLGLYLAGFSSAVGQSGRLRAILIFWLSVGWIGISIAVGNEFTRADLSGLWKFGIATPVTILTIIGLIYLRVSSPVIALSLAAVGLFSLFQNFRSHGLICLSAAGVIFAVSRRRFFRNSSLATIILIAVSLLPVAVVPSLIESGVFGAAAQAKTLMQSESSGPLFFAGRTEPPLSFAVVAASPFFGFGDAANVPVAVINQGLENTRLLGMTDQAAYLRGWFRAGYDGGPAFHSLLFQAWAEAGLGAALLYIWLIFAALRAVFAARGRLRPLFILLAFQAIWDTLFSPYSGAMIPLWALLLLVFARPNTRAASSRSTGRLVLPQRDPRYEV